MEKPRFEDEIRAKLEGHSSAPSPDLWGKIEGQINAPAPGPFTRLRLPLAAAAVVAITAVSYIFMDSTPNQRPGIEQKDAVTVRQQKPEVERINNPPQLSDKTQQHPEANPTKPDVTPSLTLKGNRSTTGNKGTHANKDSSFAGTGSLQVKTDSTRNETTMLSENKRNAIALPSVQIRIETLLESFFPPALPKYFLTAASALVDNDEKPKSVEQQEIKTPIKKSSWLAVGFASGNFQQQILTGSPDAGLSRASSMYYGWNLGRLSLFTGVAMAEQEYNRTSNLAAGTSNMRKAVSNDMISGNTATADFSATSTYVVNTQRRYLSVPVQAGWFVVDRRIKGMVSTGIISDYFLNSTISDVSGLLQSSTVTRGAGTSYAGWIFSGMAGTEWSMGFMDHYQIAVSPGVRYALTPVYRKDISVNGKSYAFDVAVRLRYFFSK